VGWMGRPSEALCYLLAEIKVREGWYKLQVTSACPTSWLPPPLMGA
jgi:hypothetical protein